MAYNYAAAYGTSYGQYNQQQASAYSSQQSSASGYGHYGQTSAAYGTAGSTAATTTTASSVNTYGYASATPATTTTAHSTYNYGYNYNYGTDTTPGFTTPASSALQVFQQNWYNNTSAAGTGTQQQTASTSQASTVSTQQQQYGQYFQQYQQQLNAYQQYTNSAGSSSSQQQQQGLFKTPPAVGARSSDTQAKTDSTQQATGWNAYNQSQQQSTAQTTNRADPTKTGWGAYNQQQNMAAHQQTNTTGNQQKPTNIVYRTPMKYSNDATQYGASNASQNYSPNQPYKPPTAAGNTAQQGYGNMNQNYNASQQGYNAGVNQGYGTNQSYTNPQTNQMYNMNQAMYKTQPVNYNTGNQGYQSNQNYGGNFNAGNQGNYKGYGMGMNNNQIGGNNMQGQRNNVRPMVGNQQRSPMNNNAGYGQGPRDGPEIPPFPRAWHAQDNDGPRPQESWQGQRGYGDQRDRWGRGGGNMGPRGGRFGNQHQQPQQQMPPQQRGMYNNNSRHARGASGSNRELWSPAVKKGSGSSASSKSDRDGKTTPKKEEFEVIDKEKHPEIKTFLYAWLGARHTRPTYDIRQIGERPNITFRCDLRVDNYNFVGVGKAASKKDAQTTAAWKFGEYLVKIGELKESELPNKLVKTEDTGGEIGDVKEEVENRRNEQNRNRQGQNRNRRNRDRMGNQNWGSGGQGRPQMQNEIPALMALPLGPMGPPPHMMGPPPPGLMDYGPPHPHWDDGWGGPPVGPPMGMVPPMMMMRQGPPPFMKRNQNDFWRRRDIEERMMDLSRGNDRMHPEDMFISQMIRNQQEGERRRRGGRGPMMMPPPMMEAMPGEWERVQQTRPVVSADDRHVMSKHSEVYPQEGELKNLHRIVNCVEQALKLLSDKFVDQDHPREEVKKDDADEPEEETKKENEKNEGEKKDGKADEEKEESDVKDEKETKDESGKSEEKKDDGDKAEEKRAKIKILKRPKKVPRQVDTRPRVLCGVNRIGPLAKGLLITRDDHVDLALLCGEIPTVKLLDRIMGHFDEKLTEVDEEFKLIVIRKQEDAGFLIRTVDESSPVEVMVTLTAMALRKPPRKEQDETEKDEEKAEKTEEDEVKEETNQEEGDDKSEKREEIIEPDPEGMLPKRKMLDALACLRHTHWFQAKACTVHSCVVLSRILRDLQRRDELWNNLTEWALEVLIFSCLTSSEEQMSPGDACRRFFEVIAGGLLLPGMPGILDPCEKGLQNDVLDCLTEQNREDITRSAQRYLRHLAFREIHIILGMEKLPPSYKMENNPSQQRPFRNQTSSNEPAEVEEKERQQGEPNNLRKRRFEHNGSDSVAESPKRSLTDEEDTDTQQNLAELSISDEASEGRSAALDDEETTAESKEKDDKTSEIEQLNEDALLEKDSVAMETTESETKLTEEEENALLEEKMDT